MNIKEYIKELRPALSENSVKTYTSILTSLYNQINNTKEINDISFFNNSVLILEHLKNVPVNKRKTILSSLVVLTNNDDYKTQMRNDVNDYQNNILKQEKTEYQKENWINTDEVKEIYDNLETTAKRLYKKKEHTIKDLQEIQNFIIISLLGGQFIAPRRSLDYTNFKILNIDETTHNFYDELNNQFVFTRYKTSQYSGTQYIPIPVKLRNIIKKWISINPTEYLLFDTNLNPLSSVKLTQRMNKIFDGKNISTNQMRHTYLTDKFKNTSIENKNLEKTMTLMGSSVNVAPNYIKIK